MSLKLNLVKPAGQPENEPDHPKVKNMTKCVVNHQQSSLRDRNLLKQMQEGKLCLMKPMR